MLEQIKEKQADIREMKHHYLTLKPKKVRNLKEGIELHPIRHWSKWCIIGIFFIKNQNIYKKEVNSYLVLRWSK
ncbi:MAG: hypothetical protein FE041_01800 [Thermoplasmata archaeon]|nr:MAG: hypothetical protein FE041_01800 [Thermoplasmata archaeon]